MKGKLHVKYTAKTENQISIYNNCLIHKGDTTLYYCVKLYNYKIYTANSIAGQIELLYNLITNIENLFGTLSFSIFRFEDIVSPSQYKEKFLQTVALWDPNFTPSKEFMDNIKYTSQEYCFLAININDKQNIDFNVSLKKMFGEYRDLLLDSFTSFRQQKIDTDRIDGLNEKILNIGQGMIKACPEEVLVAYYIKRIFPSYTLALNKDELDINKQLITYLKQDLTPKFNYFEMSNTGVELLGAEQRVTYGSVVDIVEFPEEIISESFSLDLDSLVVNCRTLTKGKAKRKFTRKKSDIEFEAESAAVAGANAEMELEDYKDLADLALAAIGSGRRIAETDIHILVTAGSLEELNKKRFGLISMLKNMQIIATFAPDQAKEYVDSFIRLRPAKYPYLLDLRYPLSFRLTQGSSAGDFDSKYTSPIIGETVSREEATES